MYEPTLVTPKLLIWFNALVVSLDADHLVRSLEAQDIDNLLDRFTDGKIRVQAAELA